MEPIEQVKYYVYVDRKVDDGEPFFVGAGSLARTRDFKRRNRLWHNIANSHGVIRDIVFETFDEKVALDKEACLIFDMKTRDYLGGANTTDGKGSSGRNKSLKEVLSVMAKNRLCTPQGRAAASEKFSKLWLTDREMMLKARPRGQMHAMCRISESDVIAMRKEFESIDRSVRGSISRFCESWSQRLNVSGENVRRIVYRKTWTHLF
jgi:hypothetical protein